jgi:hypothetical protein
MTDQMSAKKQSPQRCEPDDCGGPVREAGGTTGAGNPAPASRTGGATGGVTHVESARRTSRNISLNKPVDPHADPGAPKAPGGEPDPNFDSADHGPIKGALHPQEPARPSKKRAGGTAGPRRTSDQR